MNTYYNYIYLDPRKRGQYTYEGLNFSLLYEPFYVGKGKGDRITSHLQENRLNERSLKVNKLKKLLTIGYSKKDILTYAIKIKSGLFDYESALYEKFLIKIFGRIELNTGTLVNMTEGGDGGIGICSNKKGKTYVELYGKRKANQLKRIQGKNKAKKYKFISPDGISYIVIGKLKQFLKEHNLPNLTQQYYREKYINVGKISKLHITHGTKSQNIIGWEIHQL